MRPGSVPARPVPHFMVCEWRSPRLAADPLRRWSLAGAALAGFAPGHSCGSPGRHHGLGCRRGTGGRGSCRHRGRPSRTAPCGLRGGCCGGDGRSSTRGQHRTGRPPKFLRPASRIPSGRRSGMWCLCWAALAFPSVRSGQSKAGRCIAVAAAVLLSLTGTGSVFRKHCARAAAVALGAARCCLAGQDSWLSKIFAELGRSRCCRLHSSGRCAATRSYSWRSSPSA